MHVPCTGIYLHRTGALPAEARLATVSQTHWKPRPELDIDLIPDYLSPGDSEDGGPLVNDSGQTKIVPLGAGLSDSF